MFGLEEYYDNLLNEARSEEEIYDVLRHKYVGRDGVPEEVLNKVFEADPTRKKSYTRWILDKWPEESELISKVKRIPLGKMFRYFQQRAHGEHPVNLVDIPSVEKAMEMMPADTDILSKYGDGPENDFDVVYDTPEWKIAVPHSYEASEKLGQGCKWCTAGYFGNGPKYFRDYTEDGPLWVNLDYRNGGEIAPDNNKEYPFKRYQFCFETDDGKGMFMDCNDDAISLKGLDMPEGVVDFYRQQNESYAETIETNDGDSSDVYNRWREDNRIVLFDNGQMRYRLSLLPSYDYDEEVTDSYTCQLYPADDMYEEIMDNEFVPYDYMVRDFTKDTDTPMMAMILKDEFGRECAVCYNRFINSWEGSQCQYEYDEKHSVLMWWYGDTINIKWSKYPGYVYDGALPDYDILGVKVSEVTDVANDGCLYVEINEKSEGKTLLKVDPKSSRRMLKSVIRSDVPKNGQHFVPIVRDGSVYVDTVSATYNITKNGEVYSDRNPDWKHVSFEKKLNDHLYIVFERVSKVENVYDSETKSMVFKQWANSIGERKGSEVLAIKRNTEYGGETLLYNYKSGKTSGPYKWVDFVEGPAWFALDKNGTGMWMDDEFNILEMPEQHIENINDYNHDRKIEIYRDKTGVHMLVMPDRKKLVPDGMEKYAKLWNGVYYFHNDTEGCLIDMVSFKIYPAPPNIVGARNMVKAESYKAAPGRWFIVVDSDGKTNMCAAGQLLLNHFVEDICQNDGTNNPDFFIFMDGNMYVYRMSDGAVLPQKYGIRGFVDTSNHNTELPVFKVRGNSEGGYVNVIYDYRKNAIADIESDGVEYDLETVVEAVLGPKSNFFESTFKSWMNRMSVVSD